MPNAAAAIPTANEILVTPYPPKPGVPKRVKELTILTQVKNALWPLQSLGQGLRLPRTLR